MKEIECPWCGRATYIFEYHHVTEHCRYCGKNVRPSPLAKKLVKVIYNLLDIAVYPFIKRCYPGHWQRSVGAWTWSMDSEDGYWNIGSQWAATEVAKAKRLSYIKDIGQIDIIVEEEG